MGIEILRRLLLVVGGMVATLGFTYAAIYAFSSSGASDRAEGAISMLLAVAGFFAWRAMVNWVLMYHKPPPDPDADF